MLRDAKGGGNNYTMCTAKSVSEEESRLAWNVWWCLWMWRHSYDTFSGAAAHIFDCINFFQSWL